MIETQCSLIPTPEYHSLIQKMRDFFLQKNFKEVPVQSRISILAACEDPFTVGSFNWEGLSWPLPQTGQMWLEHELLSHPEYEGVFAISTSYRDEPNPVLGRHLKIFPMFEFESHGTMEDLVQMEKELLEFLGFSNIGEISYAEACEKFGVDLLDNEEEEKLCAENDAVLLTHFPTKTDPFWNMKYQGEDLFSKIDVILMGQEAIGSAERSTNPEEMRHFFDTVSGGKYRQKLYDLFGKERVEKELEDYLSYDFFPRFGGGIGVTRVMRALRLLSEDLPSDLSLTKS